MKENAQAEEEAANDKAIRHQASQMVADVEKRIEGSLAEKLETRVAELTQTLEAGEEERDRARSERDLAEQETAKHKRVAGLDDERR